MYRQHYEYLCEIMVNVYNSTSSHYTAMKTYCWTRQASQRSRARRMFRDDFSAIRLASSGGRLRPSFLHVCCRTVHSCKEKDENKDYRLLHHSKSNAITSSLVGAATRIPKHRLLMAGMTLLVELQQSTSLHVAMYFSIVLRRACCASLVSWSTSVRTTTVV